MKAKGHVSGILFIGITLLYIHSAMAQERQVINGTVRDEATGKPVRSVNVFFEGTLNGTATDSTGNFTLYPQTNVKLPILVSGIGYFSKTITDYGLDRKLVVALKEHPIDLDAVTVTASDGMSRAEKVKIFKREFLGASPNAKSCEILNEDDLRFTYSSKTHILKATCDKPLIIHNKNLGYTLNFLLSSFTYTGQQTAFYGSQFFREDASPADPEKVKKARKNVYLGSQMHFIRSLWNNEMAKNGFDVFRKFQQLTYDSLVVIKDNQKYLRFSGLLKIPFRTQVSFMEGTGKAILMDKNGYLDPSGIVWTGTIGMQRAGDMLPLEYTDVAPGRESKEIKNSVSTIAALSVSLDTLHSRMPQEKLYIQLDKPYYSIGDTLRMKAYLLDAAQGKGSEKSGIVYVEMANDSNKVFFRRMLPMGYGLGTGNIILDKKEIPEGSYTLRAYTNLMRNFGEEVSFRKNLYISSGTSQNWLVNSKTTLAKQSGKDNLQLVMQFNQMNRQALRQQELEIRILDGDKVLQRDKVQTDIDGKLDVNFNLPQNASGRNLSMVAADPKDANHKITIPIPVNRPENIDLQFMPEGGNLVTGVPSRVGFKAIGEDGNAVEVSGKIYNSSNEEVASFASSYKGMGSFELKPLGTSTYTAKVSGTTKSFPLPTVKNTGSVLRITNSASSDSVKATVTVSTNLATTSSLAYHLVGQSGGKVYYDEEIPVNGNTFITKGIAKDLFPTGVARFTLMNLDRQPLNERIAFIDHYDNLDITLQAAKASYKTRDSVNVEIEVRDSEGRPVEGSFSLAVTDDSQVHTDSLSTNILTQMLLTSGLKGTVEEPGHYLQTNPQAAIDMDHLLLTQGWIGYDWKEVFSPPAIPVYAAEPEFTIKGKVTNVSKSSQATAVVLMSSRPSLVKAVVAAKDGSFTFSDFPAKDTLRFFVQARNPKVKSLEIEQTEFKPATFKPASWRYIPWYVNSDTTLLRQASTRAMEEGKINAKGTNLLQEVTITDKRIIKGSKNLNGPGESDQTLDEKDLAMGSTKTLLDVMQEKIKGFNIGVFPDKNPPLVGLMNSYGMLEPGGMPGTLKPNQQGSTIFTPFVKKQSYRIYDKEVHLVIDGIDIEQFYFPADRVDIDTYISEAANGKNENVGRSGRDYITLRNAAPYTDRQEFIRSYLKYIKADNVKGVEVMHDPKYNAKYKDVFSSNILGNLSVATTDFAFVEVTTYSGNGAFMVQPPGVALYRPLPFVNNASFYKPKYTSKPSPLADLRSTIHWEPDIVTDKQGKAMVSFYSADRPGTYSIIMEGSNMNGSVGRKTGTITIK